MHSAKVIEGHNIINFRFEKQYELAMTFVRVQEFYESDLPRIRGFYFTLEDLIDATFKKNESWTYPADWGGFNVPGHIVDLFLIKFRDLTKRELSLFRSIHDLVLNGEIDKNKPYYIIGSPEDEDPDNKTLDHEIRHAYWYLYDDYRKDMLDVIDKYKVEQIKATLIKWGYCSDVMRLYGLY